MTEDQPPKRMPPPAFPPGSRRHAGTNHRGGSAEGSEDAAVSGQDEAFFYPEEGGRSFTFISPDEPFPEREDEEEGTATGIGDDAHVAPEELAAAGDPFVGELTASVAKLAEALRRRGEAGLHASPDMSRFEATLRAYCVGYLAGRRAEANDRQGY